MKRVWREMLLGAVSCVATVGAGGGVLLVPDEARAQQPPRPAVPPGEAADQEAPPAEQDRTVRRILVDGNQRIEDSTVLSYVPLQPGDALTGSLSDAIIKTLFATGLFADVDLSLRDGDLNIRVVENPIINRVIFEGVRALKEEDLTEEIQAAPRAVFTQSRVQADVQRIVELYRRNGRFAATVTPSVRELEQNRIDLIFTVSEGPTTGVKSINFIGNRAFSDGELRSAIVTEQSKWWKILTTNDNYDPDRLDYDRELLRQYYTGRGYADFRVVSAVAELSPDQKDFYVTFTIDEGEQYDWGDVKVDTQLDRLDETLLEAVIPIREGRRFDGELIEDSIDAMTFIAGTSGYANVSINPATSRDRENRKFNITFEVNEGPRVFVDRIDIIGNTATVDEVIRRELRIVEGDAFNRVLLDRSRARLRALGFFSEVEIEEKPGADADRATVEVKVTEQPTGELALQAGFSNTENFLFDVSVSQRNLRGRGQFLRLRAATSARRQQLDLRFTEPRFLGRNLAAGFDVFLQRTDFLDISSFERTVFGGQLRASFPLTERTGLGLTYTLQRDDINIGNVFNPVTNSIVDQCTGLLTDPPICASEGQFTTSLIGYNFSLDRRNDPIAPTGGYNFLFAQDFAGAGGNVNYIRSTFDGGIYRGLPGPFRASFLLSAGFIMGWNGDDVRLNDRFFRGATSFRGFDIAGVGPRQLTFVEDTNRNLTDIREGQSLGANAFGIGTIQIDFPLPVPKEFGISAALFYEFGTVGLLDDSVSVTGPRVPGQQPGFFFTDFVDDSLSYRASAGISFFWDSPFGPVQFDFAEVLNREEYDQPLFFNFRTRTRF